MIHSNNIEKSKKLWRTERERDQQKKERETSWDRGDFKNDSESKRRRRRNGKQDVDNKEEGYQSSKYYYSNDNDDDDDDDDDENEGT